MFGSLVGNKFIHWAEWSIFRCPMAAQPRFERSKEHNYFLSFISVPVRLELSSLSFPWIDKAHVSAHVQDHSRTVCADEVMSYGASLPYQDQHDPFLAPKIALYWVHLSSTYIHTLPEWSHFPQTTFWNLRCILDQFVSPWYHFCPGSKLFIFNINAIPINSFFQYLSCWL